MPAACLFHHAGTLRRRRIFPTSETFITRRFTLAATDDFWSPIVCLMVRDKAANTTQGLNFPGTYAARRVLIWLNPERRRIMDHSNHIPLRDDELLPTTLEGAVIYGPGDEKIGSVSHVHGSQVVIDVGGFLGIGSKPVAISTDQLDFMRDEDGEVHAVTDWTKEELKSMPEHTD